MTYFDTTSASHEEHKRYTSSAKIQDKAVLSWFVMSEKGALLTPSEVHESLVSLKYIHAATPLTSVRRSITNLTKQGQLLKTDTKKKGPLGRSEMAWKLAPIEGENGQMKLF